MMPNTFMNRSGESVSPMAAFYRIKPSRVLIIHDELDLPPGTARLKFGGGHGGHNGLRNIACRLGTPGFMRLRIGIGHPGAHRDVSGFVLNTPPSSERQLIEDAIEKSIMVLPDVVSGDFQKAMNKLHTGSVNEHGQNSRRGKSINGD